MTHLALFSMHNLALLSDWLQETGELFVDIYYHRGAGGYNDRFVRSMNDLKTVIVQETWNHIAVTVYRRQQYPLRGVADENLLKEALQLIPDGKSFSIINLSLENYLAPVYEYVNGTTHEDFKKYFAQILGEEVGIGREPASLHYELSPSSRPNEIFDVSISHFSQNTVVKNQDYYEPYAKEPEKYRWLDELWRA